VISETEIDDNVYNGTKLVNTTNSMFMDAESIRLCMLSLKPKNSAGFDRIPQTEFNIIRSNRLLVGMTILSNKFHELNGMIPLEWLNSSITSFKLLCKIKFLTFEG
jgi:hypothetical protein